MTLLYLTPDEVQAYDNGEKSINGDVTLISIYALLSIRALVEVVVVGDDALTDRINGELDYLCQVLS